MQEPHPPEGVADDASPRFDVRARLTGRVPAEVVLKTLVTQVRMPADKAEALVQALRASPSATIGRGVSRERADKARALAVDGLEIDVSPVLSLAPKHAVVGDGMVVCPACGHRGVLTEERQCGACGVYVDKVSPEAAMRRRLLEQERAKLAWQEAHQAQQAEHESLAAMEARLREEIRAELERRHGRRRGPIWRELWRLPQFIGGFSATVLAAFTAGWWMPTWLHPEPAAAPVVASGEAAGAPPGSVEALLARLDRYPTAAGPAASAAALSEADSLSARKPRMPPDVALTTALSQAPGLPEMAPGGAVPADLVPHWRGELAVALARAGQDERAAEARRALEPWRQGVAPEIVAEVRRARMLVDAWGLREQSAGAAAPRLAQLRADVANLVEPVERATTLSALVPVLAQAPAVPEDIVVGLLAQVGQAVKTVADPAERQALSDRWLLAEAEALLAWSGREARDGHFSRLAARQSAVAALLPHAQAEATQAHLLALQLRLARLGGEASPRLLSAWQGALDKVADLPAQVRVLRAVAQAPSAVPVAELQRQAARLAARAEAAEAGVRAQTLAELALLGADQGDAAQLQAQGRRALSTPNLTADHQLRLRTQLLGGGHIGLAQAALLAADPAAAESHWRLAAQYIL